MGSLVLAIGVLFCECGGWVPLVAGVSVVAVFSCGGYQGRGFLVWLLGL